MIFDDPFAHTFRPSPRPFSSLQLRNAVNILQFDAKTGIRHRNDHPIWFAIDRFRRCPVDGAYIFNRSSSSLVLSAKSSELSFRFKGR